MLTKNENKTASKTTPSWTLRLNGNWTKTSAAARALGGPHWFKPAAIVPMPMTVVHDGLRDAHVWRVHHWGLYREPVKVFWGRDKDGSFKMDAYGSQGVPMTLFKQASALWPGVSFTLDWPGASGTESKTWSDGALALADPLKKEAIA